MTTVMGFAAFGIDAGLAYNTRRSAQNAADSAAFSAANAHMAATPDLASQARAVSARYGFRHGIDGAQVIVNRGPTSGAYAGDPRAVEVIVSRPARRLFSGFLTQASPTIRARAVALAGSVGDACVLALHPTSSNAILLNGSTDVELDSCSMAANSNSATALYLNGSPSLSAESIRLVGGYGTNGSPQLTTASGVRSGQSPLEDPYEDVEVPAYGGCTYYNHIVNGSGSFSFSSPNPSLPTVFCGGLTINGMANVTFNPGIYIIKGGRFMVNGSPTLLGEGVTFVLTGVPGDYATATINGSAASRLTAPGSGAMAGLLFYQDRRAPEGTATINGSSSQMYRGALYFPRQRLTFNGSSNTSGGCTQLLAATILFNGSADFGLDCDGVGIRAAGGKMSSLVE